MIYQTYPEKCLPSTLSPAGAVFPDGTYQDFHQIDLEGVQVVQPPAEGQPPVMPSALYQLESTIVAAAYTPIDPGPAQTYVKGRRRVRAPNVSVQFEFQPGAASHTYLITFLATLAVKRENVNEIFDRDVLAVVYGNRIQSVNMNAGQLEGVSEDLNIVYPGVVDLESGDTLIVRYSGAVRDTNSATQANQLLGTVTVTAVHQAFVKFG